MKWTILNIVLAATLAGCKEEPAAKVGNAGEDPQVTTRGTIEVTAKLVEVPEGAIFKRELYDYAAILKFEVIKTHRGHPHAQTIYVGHYNPIKPRPQAADRRVKDIGGNAPSFVAGKVYRMALEMPLDDHFIGGIVNKYFGKETGALYWAVWTNTVQP